MDLQKPPKAIEKAPKKVFSRSSLVRSSLLWSSLVRSLLKRSLVESL